MSFSNSEVIRRFKINKPNRNHGGKSTWKGSTVFSEDRTLYSWGRHFVLAYRFKDNSALFLMNADKYSSSTNGHQADVQRALAGPTLSFSALNAAGVWPDDIKAADVLEYSSGKTNWLLRDPDGVLYEYTHNKENVIGNRFKAPSVGEFRESKFTHTEKVVAMEESGWKQGFWHTADTVLLKAHRRRSMMHPDGEMVYLLSGVDEGSYFLSELGGPANTLDEAYRQLKPQQVHDADSDGRNVQRQGEWYFVPTPLTREDIREKMGRYAAMLTGSEKKPKLATVEAFKKAVRPRAMCHPIRDAEGAPMAMRSRNVHQATRTILFPDEPNGMLVSGKVYHRRAVNGELTREHATVDLGDVWHRVYVNTEKNSWGSTGRVD